MVKDMPVLSFSSTANKIAKTWGMIELFKNWPLALVDRFHLVDGRPILYSLRSGVRFLVQAGTRDVRVINEIWIDKVYTSPSVFAIHDEWVVADLGGHKGIFSILAATSARNVKVYTFEPAPSNYIMLRRNVELNGLTNIQTFNIAVSAADGEAILHVAGGAECPSLLQRSDIERQDDVPVQTWTIERVLKTIGSPVNLLKMDIEGMEYDAFLSCPREALQSVERIALEYHDSTSGHGLVRDRIRELVDLLFCAGFSVDVRPERRILLAQRATHV